MNDELVQKFCEEHMVALQKQLKDIYTIETPEVLNDQDESTINVNDKLSEYRFMEAVYASIEQSDQQEGEVYHQYQSALDQLRAKKTFLLELKEEIEEKNEADIVNIKIMINAFQKEM
ncbi:MULTISPECIES: hypothetical protein [Bacillaceae]|uniref:Uncharacterized protein n=2 Tax=Bacillaceae TaxID=186817 RepID=A0A9D5DNK1_9BACI|nr:MULTISPECIES: hypothetical protein [Bacillaceae]KQL57110.1 hypothetical protein AN965_10580 [Alkalicoccobacillus plakortidis]MBG9783602.1 hypothetical protein [Shouchella lehensis]RQW21417.1 hypothetical protein EH196_15400 [Bacillus sp. C1-1]TES51450.1 hypothetical protein E2L03_05905 [Shouchella lehensis]